MYTIVYIIYIILCRHGYNFQTRSNRQRHHVVSAFGWSCDLFEQWQARATRQAFASCGKTEGLGGMMTRWIPLFDDPNLRPPWDAFQCGTSWDMYRLHLVSPELCPSTIWSVSICKHVNVTIPQAKLEAQLLASREASQFQKDGSWGTFST